MNQIPSAIPLIFLLVTCVASEALAQVEDGSKTDSGESTAASPEDENGNGRSTENSVEGHDSDDPVEEVSGKGDSPSSDAGQESANLPSDPAARLREAERAFRNAEFDRIPTLLEPTLEPEPTFGRASHRLRARELLGVGYFFAAQQATNAERRDSLLDDARKQFWAILQERPDYSLDSLIFPASVVELFESVREEHAEELASLRRSREQSPEGQKAESNILYIQRQVQTRTYAVNFLPFGIGQFQNNSPVKGALFAGGQVAAIGLNTVGFVIVESLRNPETGKFSHPPGQVGGKLEAARNWRTLQWASIGAFGGIYLWSVIDALVEYRPKDVRIRTLDKPPPELESSGGTRPSSGGGSTGMRPKLRIGLGSVRIRW